MRGETTGSQLTVLKARSQPEGNGEAVNCDNRLARHQLFFLRSEKLAGLDDLAGNRRSRHHVRRGEIELAGAGATGEIAILRADRDRLSRRRSPRARIDAGATRWIDQLGAGPLEDLDIAAIARVLLDPLRTKLQIQ